MESFRFRLLGFPVEVLPNALFLAGIFLLFGLGGGWSLPMIGATIVIAFVSVLFHELGHATTARWFRLEPISITLHGFGGLTRHRPANSALKELVVVLAGPLAGFLLAAVAFAGLLLPLPPFAGDVVQEVLVLNVVWSVFNLLPIFPLDGGHALGNGLALAVGPARAWPVTWGIGLVGAVLLGLAMWQLGQIFVLFLAGMFAWRNWQLLQAWRSHSQK